LVEAPSQLLEYWCWVPECLQRLSCHYSYVSPDGDEDDECDSFMNHLPRPPKEIPRSIIERLVEGRSLNQGILTMRQIAFSSFDMEIHCPASQATIKSMDIGEIYNSLLQRTTLLRVQRMIINGGMVMRRRLIISGAKKRTTIPTCSKFLHIWT
jgi:metallopeptidase MepB